MTWPTTPVSTTNLDAGTDSPALARSDLKTAVDNVNAIAAEFGDVATTGKATDDVLAWSGTQWAPDTLSAVARSGAYSDLSGTPTVPTQLDDLTDVDLTTPATDGQALVWSDSSSAWIAGTVTGGGGGGSDYIRVIATQTQTALNGSTIYKYAFDTVIAAQGITFSDANDHCVVASAGTYAIHFTNNGNNSNLSRLWVAVNGVAVANSRVTNTNTQRDYFIVLPLNANDAVSIWTYASASGQTMASYEAAGGTPPNDYPARPGAALEIYQI